MQGLAMLGIYLFGIVSALLVAAVVSRVEVSSKSDVPFVLGDAAVSFAWGQGVASSCLGS